MKLVILDRDGTVNAQAAEGGFIRSPEDWVPLPGALEAIAQLNHMGWHVVVASNQSGLGRGLYEVGALNAVNAKFLKSLAAVGGRVDALFYCPHSEEEACQCRKPLPGLFEQIRDRLGVDMQDVPAVGDSLRDVLACTAVGCEPHLVLTGKGAQYAGQPLPAAFPSHTRVHADLAAFAAFLLGREKRSAPSASSYPAAAASAAPGADA